MLQWLQQSAVTQQQPSIKQATKKQQKQFANEILREFCINMNEMSGDYDEVVGRREELRDLYKHLHVRRSLMQY